MNDASFKRIKHGQLPGDVGKQDKIKMRENANASTVNKAFNKMVKMKAKAISKERAKKEIKRQLEE